MIKLLKIRAETPNAITQLVSARVKVNLQEALNERDKASSKILFFLFLLRS